MENNYKNRSLIKLIKKLETNGEKLDYNMLKTAVQITADLDYYKYREINLKNLRLETNLTSESLKFNLNILENMGFFNRFQILEITEMKDKNLMDIQKEECKRINTYNKDNLIFNKDFFLLNIKF